MLFGLSMCSFVPFTLHPIIAKECLRAQKNLVTASYVSPEMQVLYQLVRRHSNQEPMCSSFFSIMLRGKKKKMKEK